MEFVANHSFPSDDLATSGRKFDTPGCTPSNTSKVLTFTIVSGRSHHFSSSESVIATSPHCVSSQREPRSSFARVIRELQGRPLPDVRVFSFPSFHRISPFPLAAHKEPSGSTRRFQTGRSPEP